jgi:hypothetical protein
MATFLAYLKDLAAACGEHGSFVTTSVGTESSLISTALLSSALTSTSLEGMAVLLESGAFAGEQRDVRPNGLTKTTGALATASDFSGAVASGVSFSAYSRLPAYRRGLVKGYLEVINDALRRLWFEYAITIAGVSGQKKFAIDTDAYPWLTSEDRIISVHLPAQDSDDDPAAISRSAWEWLDQGETRSLYFRGGSPANTGQDFTVKCYRPASSRLQLNATAQATIAGGAVTAITVTLGGYYSSAPTVTISGGGGTGATATATVTGNTVASIAVGAGGSGYTTVPTVTIAAGAWSDQTSQTSGLLGLSDEAVSDVSDVTVVGKALVYRTLAELNAQGSTVDQWLGLAAIWEKKAVGLKHFYRPSDHRTNVPNLRPTLVGGYRSRGYAGLPR